MSTQVPFVMPVNPNDLSAYLLDIRRSLDRMWFAFKDAVKPEGEREFALEDNCSVLEVNIFEVLQTIHELEDEIDRIRKARTDEEIKVLGHALTDRERAAL